MSIRPADAPSWETFDDIPLDNDEDVEKPPKSDYHEPTIIKHRRQRRRVLIASAALFLVAIGVAVGLAVGLSGRDSETFTQAEQTKVEAMGLSKSEVDSFCSPDNIGSDRGLEQCLEACAPAGCCDPFNTDDSCLQNETEACLNYAGCQTVLSDTKISAAASIDLAVVCSLENIAEDDGKQCLDACKEVECCYTEEDSCAADEFFTCLDYAPCQNLKNTTYPGVFDTLPAAPLEILDVCSPISDNHDKDRCEEICEPAACCVGDVLPGDSGCLQDNFISCLTYAPCGGLVIPQLNSIIPKPEPDLKEKCSLENVLGPDRDGCEDACEPAACCSAKDISNCLLEDPLGCLEYAQCGLLGLSGGDVPVPQDGLADLCSKENIDKGGQSLADCVEACAPSICCALPSASLNCFADNFFTCPQYWPCAQLVDVGRDVELLDSPPDNMKRLCRGHRVSDDCKDKCMEASCCFSTDTSNCLLGGNQGVCGEWLAAGCWKVPGFIG